MKIINKLTNKIDLLYSRVTGRNHQYRVVLGFKPKGSQAPTQYTIYRTFSVASRNGAAFYRTVRKHYGKEFIDQLPKEYRKNGHITIEHIVYLGRY